jgi:2'-5' RNA ligase
MHAMSLQMCAAKTTDAERQRCLEEAAKFGLTVRPTDDKKNWFVTMDVCRGTYVNLGDHLRAQIPHIAQAEHINSGKRVLSMPSHGWHLTLFYGCTQKAGEDAIVALWTSRERPDNMDYKLAEQAERFGDVKKHRNNSQCWVVKIIEWPWMTWAHEFVKRFCIPDEAERAKQRSFVPHITVFWAQDASMPLKPV